MVSVSGVLNAGPQQLLGLWDTWTDWESLLPLQVSRAGSRGCHPA